MKSKTLTYIYGKGKLIPGLLTKYHAMKAYRGSGGTSPLILSRRH